MMPVSRIAHRGIGEVAVVPRRVNRVKVSLTPRSVAGLIRMQRNRLSEQEL